jgi:hypothetical protein
MDDTPKAKRTLALSPSSWSNLYPKPTTTKLLTNEQSLLLTSFALPFAF